MEFEPDIENGDDEIADMEAAESLDLEALVKKARRSREIDESDVQTLLASVNEAQADMLYEQLHKLGIRIVSSTGKTIQDGLEPASLLASLEEDVNDADAVQYLGGDVEDDPVHTYLKEIGQVNLLLAEQEIWLSTQLAAASVLDGLSSDVAANNSELGDSEDIHSLTMVANYEALLGYWQATVEAAKKLGVETPDLSSLVTEAHQLRRSSVFTANRYITAHFRRLFIIRKAAYTGNRSQLDR
jgi:hypothetical protein